MPRPHGTEAPRIGVKKTLIEQQTGIRPRFYLLAAGLLAGMLGTLGGIMGNLHSKKFGHTEQTITVSSHKDEDADIARELENSYPEEMRHLRRKIDAGVDPETAAKLVLTEFVKDLAATPEEKTTQFLRDIHHACRERLEQMAIEERLGMVFESDDAESKDFTGDDTEYVVDGKITWASDIRKAVDAEQNADDNSDKPLESKQPDISLSQKNNSMRIVYGSEEQRNLKIIILDKFGPDIYMTIQADEEPKEKQFKHLTPDQIKSTDPDKIAAEIVDRLRDENPQR